MLKIRYTILTNLLTNLDFPLNIHDERLRVEVVTSARSKSVTIIGGANAVGNPVPPF